MPLKLKNRNMNISFSPEYKYLGLNVLVHRGTVYSLTIHKIDNNNEGFFLLYKGFRWAFCLGAVLLYLFISRETLTLFYEYFSQVICANKLLTTALKFKRPPFHTISKLICPSIIFKSTNPFDCVATHFAKCHPKGEFNSVKAHSQAIPCIECCCLIM